MELSPATQQRRRRPATPDHRGLVPAHPTASRPTGNTPGVNVACVGASVTLRREEIPIQPIIPKVWVGGGGGGERKSTNLGKFGYQNDGSVIVITNFW